MEQQGPKTLKDALTITKHFEFAQQYEDMQNTDSSEFFSDYSNEPNEMSKLVQMVSNLCTEVESIKE